MQRRLQAHFYTPNVMKRPFPFRPTAMCIRILRQLGITAVLNAAQGHMGDWNYVNTRESYYHSAGIKFFGVPAVDLKHYPIHIHFQEAADFIEQILREKGNPR